MFSEELRAQIRNVHAFAPTPFKKDNLLELDLDGLARNLEFMIERGVQVINIGGGTGENNALSSEELEALTRQALDVAGDRALIVPTLPGNFGIAATLAPRYQEMGAKIILGMAPFLRDKVPDDLEGVFHHYRLLAQTSDLPILPYNTQAWPAPFFARLAEIDRIIGIKDPCIEPHNLFRAIPLLGDRFVWVGNKRHDPGVLHFRYQAGIQGFTAGIINFAPEFELELHQAALVQDWPRMIPLQKQLAPLEKLRNVHGDALIKTALDLIGLVGGPVRPPRLDTSEAGRADLIEEMRKLGIEV